MKNDTFMKEKPVFPLVLSMSMPMVLSMLVNSLYNIVDSYFVARISENAMTALSLVYPMQNLINAVTIGFGVGINAVIAYYLGAQEQERADRATTLGTFWNAVHGILLTVIGFIGMPAFLRLFSSDTETIDYALRYSRIVLAFSIILAFGMTFEKLYQAVGKMTVSMISLLAGCVTNLILDPILIFGLGPVPGLGIEGAALATGIGQTVNLAIYLVLYFRNTLPVRLSLNYLSFHNDITKRLYSIGVPTMLGCALPSVMISALNGILASFSESYVLVLGVYYKLQNFLYLTANGIVQGIRPLVGYNYGAGEDERVRRIYRTALGMSAVIMAFGTVLCLLIPDRLFGLFTDQEQTMQTGATALRIISAGFLVSAVSVTSCGALEGLGKGTKSLLISLLRYILIIIPAAFLLSCLAGATGVWHAFWIAEWLTAAGALAVSRKEKLV